MKLYFKPSLVYVKIGYPSQQKQMACTACVNHLWMDSELGLTRAVSERLILNTISVVQMYGTSCRSTCRNVPLMTGICWSFPVHRGKSGPKDQVALHYYYTSSSHCYRNCKFHNFARTISRHADGISRYSVPPSAGDRPIFTPARTVHILLKLNK